jgi:hypothetical protein
MALEVVAGPYNVAYLGRQLDSFGGGLAATYIPGLGLLGVGTQLHPTSIIAAWGVQYDGTAFPRSGYSGAGAVIVPDLRRSRGLAAIVGGLAIHNLNWLAARPDSDAWLTPVSGFFGTIHAVAPDRFLQFGNTVKSAPLYDGRSASFTTTEYTFAGTAPGGVQSISVAGPTELCVVYGSGSHPQIRFYDWVQKTQSRPTCFLDRFYNGVWYVPKWDIFVALVSRTLYTLAHAVRPATVSNPTFAPTPTAGEVSDVSVQVLGGQSEPCVGELINWSIGAGGGSLTATQSATDATGWAHTGYVAPVGLAGSVTINADLEF